MGISSLSYTLRHTATYVGFTNHPSQSPLTLAQRSGFEKFLFYIIFLCRQAGRKEKQKLIISLGRNAEETKSSVRLLSPVNKMETGKES